MEKKGLDIVKQTLHCGIWLWVMQSDRYLSVAHTRPPLIPIDSNRRTRNHAADEVVRLPQTLNNVDSSLPAP